MDFIDTNIAIAYTFFPDKYFKTVDDFIVNSTELYCSNNVCEEYKRKYKSIFTSFEYFFDEIILALENNNRIFLNKYSFEQFVLSQTSDINLDMDKKINLINFFWEEILFGLFKEKSEFLSCFVKCSNEVPSKFEINKDYLLNKLQLYNCGLNNFRKYCDLWHSLENLGIHEEDRKIILDAHDFAKDQFTIFVTVDEEFYNAVKSFSKLNIDKYKLLN